MKKIEDQLTSVKVNPKLFENFKLECVKRKFSFNKLVNRVLDLYLTNEDFRRQITNHNTFNTDLNSEE